MYKCNAFTFDLVHVSMVFGPLQVNVFRMSNERIGCSLAEAAEDRKYLKFLEEASENVPALHVIYINTSLETKAKAHAIVPTITCTSSNVVQTVLQVTSTENSLKRHLKLGLVVY